MPPGGDETGRDTPVSPYRIDRSKQIDSIRARGATGAGALRRSESRAKLSEMKSYSFQSAGPRLAWGMILPILLWGIVVLHLPLKSAFDVILFAIGAALLVPMLVFMAWYSIVVERVTSAPDEFVLEKSALGVSLGPPRRARKADIIGTGLQRITFYRFRPASRYGSQKTFPGWSMTLQCRQGPSQSTELPLGDEDAEALIAFVRSELGPTK
jgi:hypothetical protein